MTPQGNMSSCGTSNGGILSIPHFWNAHLVPLGVTSYFYIVPAPPPNIYTYMHTYIVLNPVLHRWFTTVKMGYFMIILSFVNDIAKIILKHDKIEWSRQLLDGCVWILTKFCILIHIMCVMSDLIRKWSHHVSCHKKGFVWSLKERKKKKNHHLGLLQFILSQTPF